MLQYFRLVGLALLLLVGVGNVVKADPVDEAAKCAATFRVLTSLQIQNEQLGKYFTQLGLFSADLMGLYSESLRNSTMTNGEISELATEYQLQLDSQSSDGSSFLPYVQSCMGWLHEVGIIINEAGSNNANVREILISAPKPSLNYEYPHPDWIAMEELFFQSYQIWVEMDKITPRDIRKALGN